MLSYIRHDPIRGMWVLEVTMDDETIEMFMELGMYQFSAKHVHIIYKNIHHKSIKVNFVI